VGAWRHVGGGAVEMPIWEFPFNFDFIQRPDWIKPGTRAVNELDLGAALTGELGLDPPLMSLFIHNSNPVSQQQNANKLIQGLRREDLFTVVSELFMTDTARYADIILPASMQAEQYDLQVTWGHLYMMLNQPAISPPGDCMPNVDMFRRLAKTMGFDDDYWKMSDDELLMKMYDWNAPALQGITLEKLKEVGWMRLNVGAPGERVPHAKGNFKTCAFSKHSRALVEPAIANDTRHHSIDVLARPLFLAVFGERQLVAKNLHAPKSLSSDKIKAARLVSARNGFSVVPTVTIFAAKSLPASLGTTA
jgi:anaerobic selenocysteine-containing dehydrogenase